ncbi:MAG: hypothetical protein JXA77_16195 [Bacteroidales bacterium]|nr:hypothetical protein [Bacteroidales bacterium]MBN2821127.1 hypothetical protein [Bacteroidales bacterium]
MKNIVVVNRSLTKEEDKKGKIIESIATSEIAGSDKLASDECIKGVYDGLNGINGFSIKIPKQLRLYGTGTRETPNVLDWETVKKICDSTGTDALLVLEMFDSNTDLLLATATEQVSAILSGEVNKPKIPGQVKMNVKSYWRMYNPETKTIIDQYQHTHYLTFNLVGGVPPLEALPETAYDAGQVYVARFLPSYYTVKRDLYKKAKGKKKQEFKRGYRRAEVANWDGAIEVWSNLVEDTKQKTAGRACLNIAVGYEVLGNTEKALEWAKRSYEDYDDKLGRQYAKILLRRRDIER